MARTEKPEIPQLLTSSRLPLAFIVGLEYGVSYPVDLTLEA